MAKYLISFPGAAMVVPEGERETVGSPLSPARLGGSVGLARPKVRRQVSPCSPIS